MTRNDSQRITALEVRVEHLTETVEKQGKLIQEMHDALMTARGAKWALVGAIGLAATFGGIVGKFLPLIKS